MAWVLEEYIGKDENIGRRGQWEICGNGEWTGSESQAVFNQQFLEENQLSCFRSYIWFWEVKALGEGRGTNIGGKKSKIRSIRVKFDLYEFCLSYII